MKIIKKEDIKVSGVQKGMSKSLDNPWLFKILFKIFPPVALMFFAFNLIKNLRYGIIDSELSGISFAILNGVVVYFITRAMIIIHKGYKNGALNGFTFRKLLQMTGINL